MATFPKETMDAEMVPPNEIQQKIANGLIVNACPWVHSDDAAACDEWAPPGTGSGRKRLRITQTTRSLTHSLTHSLLLPRLLLLLLLLLLLPASEVKLSI